jgi:predicted nucleic acid-binding protein
VNLYVDASAIVKRYVVEANSDMTDGWWREAQAVASTELGFVEVHAALAKAARVGLIETRIARRQAAVWTREWPDIVRIETNQALLRVAADLTWRRQLRGYDAVHLASALRWRDALGETLTLATFDRALWDAAVSEGLMVLPAERS